LAWLESTVPSVLAISPLFVWGVLSFIEKDEIQLSKKCRTFMIMVIVIIIISTPAMLLSWTPIGSKEIHGLQGRYYIPALPLIGLVLTKFRIKQSLVISDESDSLKCSCFVLLAGITALTVYYLLRLYLTR
jgi:uncharacterized membrane protein